jgi:hypothetical protein
MKERKTIPTVLKPEFRGNVESPDSCLRRIYRKAKPPTRRLGAIAESRDRQKRVIIGAAQDCRKTTLGVERAVAQCTDANPVLLAVQLSARAFEVGARSREPRVSMDVAAVSETHGVYTGAIPGLWKWAAVRDAALNHA